jgi:ATP-binding cassette, subfamily C, type I secretion system permease/ATPase
VRDLVSRLTPLFLFAALFSLAINTLLLAPSLYMLQVFDRVLASRSEETLAVLSLAAVIALFVMMLLDVLRARLLAAAGATLDRRLGPRVLEGLMAQSARLSGSGYLHGLRDVATLRAFFSGQGLMAFFDAPWLPIFLLLICLFHPILGAAAFGGAVVMVTLAFLNERLTRGPIERAQTQARQAARFIEVGTRNADVVEALGMAPALSRRWSALNEAVLSEHRRANAIGAGFSSFTKFARQLIQLVMLGIGAHLVLSQHVTAGIMIAGTILLGRALAPVETLVGSWKGLVEARAAWRRLRALLNEGVQEKAGTELPAPLGALKVEQLVFRLPKAERPILRGVSFSLEAGEALGIIGPSASGKSTLARLIVGVWKPAAGTVRLDGADVSAWPRERLGPYLGYLPQDVELFTGTVAQNIARLGEPNATAVIRAAQRAHVHELILRLPQGYDTEMGEAGAALSPGQRQRVALARALYGEPRLVVLDEPNASLDNEGDEALLRALADLKAQRATVVIVAHRPSMLRGVDKLLVMSEGTVQLFGPRAEVLARLTRPLPSPKERAA